MNQENYTEIALKNISIIAIAKNIRIADMERKIGVSQGYYSRLRLKKNTNFDTIVKIAKYLNVSIDELIKEDLAKEIEERLCSLDRRKIE